MQALVVDDDVVSRMALMDLLSGYGIFEVVDAEDGEQAWMLLEGGLRPVICFCDVRMPRMSGIELLERIKANPALEKMPFVLVSSASDRETVLHAVKLGAIGYILKPLQAGEARVHLEKIFKLTLDKLAENPITTLKRLNISPDRLNAYLTAFNEQLAAVSADIGALVDTGLLDEARLRLDTLRTGCNTLGLWHVASLIESVRSGALDAERVAEAVAEVARDVARQSGRVAAATSAVAAPARAAGQPA